MYITILDYTNGRIIINNVTEGIDPDEYIEENYPNISSYYMTTDDIKLSINQEK